MGRQLAVANRTDLSFYKGWEGCYIDWNPANYAQLRRMNRTDFTQISDEEDEKFVIATIKERMVGGKVRIPGKDGKTELVDIQKDDIDSMPGEMIVRVVADMSGVQYDPDPLEPTKTETESLPDTSSKSQTEPTASTETQ